MESAEAIVQCKNQRYISDMEDRGSGAREREATGPGKALERPLGLVTTSQQFWSRGPGAFKAKKPKQDT